MTDSTATEVAVLYDTPMAHCGDVDVSPDFFEYIYNLLRAKCVIENVATKSMVPKTDSTC